MAYEVLDTDLIGTVPAGADLSTKQFHFVQFELKSGSLKTVLAATTGQVVGGVLQDKPSADGSACLVAGGGISKVKLGSAGTAGAYVAASADGTAITTSTTAHNRVGQLMEGGAAGEIVACYLKHVGPSVP